MNGELPEGWVECLAGDVAEVVGGGTPDASDSGNFSESGGIPWLTPADLSGNRAVYVSRGRRYLTKKGFDGSAARLLPKASVLFSSRAPIGYVAVAANELSTNQGFKSFVCNQAAYPEYLYFYLRFATPLAEELASGTTFAEISGRNAALIPVRLPPLAEQRRIADALESLTGQVARSQTRLSRVPLILERLRQSILAAACSGRLTVDWRRQHGDVRPASETVERLIRLRGGVRLRRGVPDSVLESEVVAGWNLPRTWGVYSAAALLRCGAFIDIKDGNHGANHPKVRDFTEQGLPFITAAQVNGFRIDYDGAYKLSGQPLARIRVGIAERGDVIYTHKGSVGRVAIVERPCILTPQTTYYRVSPEIFVNRYLMFYLASGSFSGQADVVKEQTTRDFVPISEQYSLFHRVPPLEEQREIVRLVDGAFKLADRIEARFGEIHRRVESLTPSLLAKAFRGELVPTEAELARAEGRAYETAEELLEKIRAGVESSAHSTEKKRSRSIKPSKRKLS